MKILDNITSTVRDDLRVEIKKGSKVSIAAACFSMYAYKELKRQLESVDEFRFIFTSPTFVKEKAEKQKREFYIPRLSRETSLYGTEFEIKLRNEMTQRAIAKECADWIRKKAKFKSNTTGENMAGFMTVDSKAAQTAYMPINGFTTVDIGCERGNNSYNMVNCMEAPFAQQYMQLFDGLWSDREKMQDVTDVVLENISTVYAENSPEFIYFIKHVRENRLYWGKSGENTYPRLKKFLSEMDGGMVPVDLWRQEDTGTTDQASKELENLLGRKIFDFPKPKELIMRVISLIISRDTGKDSIILDFFSGSATTAHAVMQLNAEDGGHRKFIMVQLPEKTDEKSEAYKAGYKNICEIGKERIRRAGCKIKEDAGLTVPADLDIGFRCLRLDESNMKPVYYTPEKTQQQDLFSLVDNVKPDRTPEDLLFQVMLDLGVLLSSSIEVKEIAGKKVFNVADGFLLACFDHDVTEETVKAIAQMKSYYAVFRDSSMTNDSVATNFEQIFETYSPDTVRKVL